MGADTVAMAARAKGALALFRRAVSISRRYSLTPEKFGRSLALYAQTLDQFGCGASWPLTAVALERNGGFLAQHLPENVELAVHGHIHADYTRLAPTERRAHVQRAREAFARAGIAASGFRFPYLRYDPSWYATLEAAGFSYASNQAMLWDVVDRGDVGPGPWAGYQRALKFYAPLQASKYPSLPQLFGGIVELPVSLPDDEMLVDRLGDTACRLVDGAWGRILAQTYRRGELFTVQLHPERIALCAGGLSATLAKARSLTPPVWIARLDQIAAWWRARAQSAVRISGLGEGEYRVEVNGPAGTTVLARAADVDVPSAPWADGYRQVLAAALTVRASPRPFVGISSQASPGLADFLRQQGYILEFSDKAEDYALFFDRATFSPGEELALLAQIEEAQSPLLRLGRWPGGARSALAVTGDIDALTLWDFGLRLMGR